MRMQAALQGRLSEHMTRELAVLAKGSTAAMREASGGLKLQVRGQVVSSGLGQRLANTIRDVVFPKSKEAIDPAAMVFTKAPKLIGAFDEGVTIKSADGFWLAIPTPEARLGGRDTDGSRVKTTPGAWERRMGVALRFVYRKTGPSLLVADDVRLSRGRGGAQVAKPNKRALKRGGLRAGQQTAVIFFLVPQVKLRKRLDIAGAHEDWTARLPGLMLKHFAAADASLPPVGAR